jgi:PhnB protein
LLLAGIAFIIYAFISKPVIENTKPPKKENNMVTLTTYLLLNGNCREAMEFYQSCFGGELTMTSVGNSPMKNMFAAGMHNRILNAKLVCGNITISASDWLRPLQTPVQGNTVCLYLDGGSYSQLKGLFDHLSAGGDITDPLRQEVFGTYGALNDKFGIRWMFHTDRE